MKSSPPAKEKKFQLLEKKEHTGSFWAFPRQPRGQLVLSK